MNIHHYISKARRDKRWAELKKAHPSKTFKRSTSRGSQLHPEYITDAREEGITYETGFGNTDYQRVWGVLYNIIEVQRFDRDDVQGHPDSPSLEDSGNELGSYGS